MQFLHSVYKEDAGRAVVRLTGRTVVRLTLSSHLTNIHHCMSVFRRWVNRQEVASSSCHFHYVPVIDQFMWRNISGTWIFTAKVQGCYIFDCTDFRMLYLIVFFSLNWPCDGTFATEYYAENLISMHSFVPVRSASNYFKVVHSMHFSKSVYRVFISSSKSIIICKH